MKSSSSELLRELCAASVRLQHALGIAARAGRSDVAGEIKRTSAAIDGLIGRIDAARAPEVVS